MTKVLQVVSGLGSGGVENMLYNYISKMDLDKYRFDFIVHDPIEGVLETKFAKLGCPIYHVTPKRKSILKNLKEINQIIRNGNYDIIHCHQNEQSFVPLILAKHHKIRHRFAHSHVAFSETHLLDAIKKFVPKNLTRIYSNHKLACSSLAGRYLFMNSDFSILYNAIDLDAFRFNSERREFIRRKFNWESEFVIGNIARFYPEKNHGFLLEIFREILKVEPNSKLVLIGGEGSSEQKEKIIDCIKEYDLEDDTILLGIRDDIPDLMQAMDCFVMPSKFEGFGMVLIEAQAASLLTYTSDVVPRETRQSEFITYISLNESSYQWAQNIIADQETYQREQNSMSFERFDINKEFKRLEQIYAMCK